jgi:hypothetical protein
MKGLSYLRSTGKTFCSLLEKVVDSFAGPPVVTDESSSTDSDRFLFPGAAKCVVESFWGRVELPFGVVIADWAR